MRKYRTFDDDFKRSAVALSAKETVPVAAAQLSLF